MKRITRCKFVCTGVAVHGSVTSGFTYDYEFCAVTSGSEENKNFWKWTPSGKLTFGCTHAKDQFIPGEEYYLDIMPITDLKQIES